MTAFVFIGPSISRHAASEVFDAVYLPPAAQGDLLRLLGHKPTAIGIVDGYFERVPAVWHKEILWALSRGVPVFGSSSMGAIRAAELATFGMTGVGQVFERFRSGELEGDDEVAVVHGDDASGFAPASEALVVIRATLERAASEGVLSEADREILIAGAKARFYPDRCWPAVFADGRAAGLEPLVLDRLRRWLPGRIVDCKRDDALELLSRMCAHARAGSPPVRVAFNFEHTEWFAHALRTAGQTRVEDRQDTVIIDPERVLDEVRLTGDRFRGLRRDALLRAFAEDEARRGSVTPTAQAIDDARAELAVAVEPYDLEVWRERSGLTAHSLEDLLRIEAIVRWAETTFGDEVVRRGGDCLRVSGEYPELVARALDKHRFLEERGLLEAPLELTGLDRAGLVAWYVGSRPEANLPPDPVALVRDLGLSDVEALERLLSRERLYSACQPALSV